MGLRRLAKALTLQQKLPTDFPIHRKPRSNCHQRQVCRPTFLSTLYRGYLPQSVSIIQQLWRMARAIQVSPHHEGQTLRAGNRGVIGYRQSLRFLQSNVPQLYSDVSPRLFSFVLVEGMPTYNEIFYSSLDPSSADLEP
jgi:hypothetical protein